MTEAEMIAVARAEWGRVDVRCPWRDADDAQCELLAEHPGGHWYYDSATDVDVDDAVMAAFRDDYTALLIIEAETRREPGDTR